MLDIRVTPSLPSSQRPAFHVRFFEGGKAYDAFGGRAPAGKRAETLNTDTGAVTATFVIDLLSDYQRDDARRVAGGTALRYARRWGGAETIWHLDGKVDPARFAQLISGALLSDYEFQAYKSETSGARNASKLIIVAGSNTPAFKAEVAAALAVNVGVCTARDLANCPPNDLPPAALAARAKEICANHGLAFKMLDRKQLQAGGYTGLISVGQGSSNEPVLFSMTYKPEKASKDAAPLCLVGKGITFDTGGISIKPWDGMWDMKADMGGAAAVIGAMQAIALLKPPMAVTGVVAAAENMPDGAAYRPGDILKYRNGRTVEIHSTDAEGRLVLADALIYAQETLGQSRIVEFSTLTGACVRALGHQYIGLMSRAPELAGLVKTAAEQSGELVWELPLHPEYRAMIKSSVADIKNVGGALAGAQTAGMFLHEFIQDGTEYVHLDIAGVFLAEKVEKYWSQAGATGAGVRLAARLADLAAEPGQPGTEN